MYEHFRLVRPGFLLVTLLLCAAPAFAHKVCAIADGIKDQIEGEVLYGDGRPVRGAGVEIFTPDGKLFAKTKVGEDGTFTVKAKWRCDYRVVIDAGDGHRAEVTAKATDFASTLPAFGETAKTAKPVSAAAGTAEAKPVVVASTGGGDLAVEIEALSKQVRNLRKDLKSFKESAKIHDMLGGIGVIFGAFGIAAFCLARKRASATAQ